MIRIQNMKVSFNVSIKLDKRDGSTEDDKFFHVLWKLVPWEGEDRPHQQVLPAMDRQDKLILVFSTRLSS